MAAISRQPLQTHDNGTFAKQGPQPQYQPLLTPGTWLHRATDSRTQKLQTQYSVKLHLTVTLYLHQSR